MGEVAFKKGIQDYYAKFYTASATTDDFRMAMEKVSGMDLKVFFNQWLAQPIIPNIQVAWEYDVVHKRINIVLDQTQKGDVIFDLPVEIALYKKGVSTPTILKIHVDKKQKIQSFKWKEAPEKVELDPRNVLLCESNK